MANHRTQNAKPATPPLRLVRSDAMPSLLPPSHRVELSPHTHPRFRQRRDQLAIQDCIATLEQLMRHAYAGRISGLLWGAIIPEGLHPRGTRMEGGMVGEVTTNPEIGMKLAVELASQAVNQAIEFEQA